MCIYCQKKEGNSREHIIPDALLARIPNEAWIIQKGSCTECQKIINPIETDIIKNLYKGLRPALGIKKGEVEIFSIMGDKLYSPDIYFIGKCIFERPTLLSQTTHNDGKISLREFYTTTYDPKHLISQKLNSLKFDKIQVATMEYSPANYLKMVAKIAYGFYVFQFGETVFHTSPLPNIIKGNFDNFLGRYIGSLKAEETYEIYNTFSFIRIFENTYHKVSLLTDNKIIIAIINLFSKEVNGKNDSYIVVVDEIFSNNVST